MNTPTLPTSELAGSGRVGTRRRSASRNLVKSAQAGFALFVVVMVVSGLWELTRQQSGSLPQEIVGFKMTQTVGGQAALDMTRELHLGSPQIQMAQVSFYEGDATIWVGGTGSDAEARQQLEAMARAIGSTVTPFSAPVETEVAGRRVFTVTDSARRHYFFQSANRVVWVTPPRGYEERFTQAVLRVF